MSSTLKRIKNIMSCNVKRFLDRSNKDESDIKEYIRKFESEAGKIQAQSESIITETSRRKRALNECEDSIAKMDRYIKKSMENGNNSDVRLFEEKREAYVKEREQLSKAYETAKSASDKIEAVEKKINSDISILRERLNNIKEREAEVNRKSQEYSVKEKLNTLEKKVNAKADEAAGMREIDEYLSDSSSEDDDLDKLFEELENDNK